MMGTVRVIRIAAGVAVGLAACWACGGTGAFQCTEDAQCSDGTASGTCEASGYCSFVDDACPSGQRYGGLAPAGLARMCVSPTDTTAGTEGDDGSSPLTSTSGADATSTSPGTSSPTTTLPVDPGSTGESIGEDDATGPSATESGSSNGEDGTTSGTTGPPVPMCEVTFADAFDNGLDPEWDTWSSPGSWFALDAETLLFSIAPSAAEWVSAGLYTQLHSFLGGHVRAEVVPFADPIDPIGVWLTMFDQADCEIQIAVESSAVRGHSAGTWFDPVAVDTTIPIQLQLRVDPDGLVHWEYSTDAGRSWSEVYAETPPCDFSSAHSAIFAGGVHDHPSAVVREVEWYELCEAP